MRTADQGSLPSPSISFLLPSCKPWVHMQALAAVGSVLMDKLPLEVSVISSVK